MCITMYAPLNKLTFSTVSFACSHCTALLYSTFLLVKLYRAFNIITFLYFVSQSTRFLQEVVPYKVQFSTMLGVQFSGM